MLAFVVSLLLLQAIVVAFLGIETKKMPLEALSGATVGRGGGAATSAMAETRAAPQA